MIKSLDFLTETLDLSSLDPVTYEYFNQRLKHRTIVFNQGVDESILETVILPLQEFEKDDNQDPVTLIIQSPGGSVLDGLTVCNVIDNYKKKLNIYIYGYAFSMAFIISCSGNNNPNVTKYCHPFSFFLNHPAVGGIEGDIKSMSETIAFNEKLEEIVKNYIISNTKITEEEYTKAERKQNYMTAQEAKEKGFVDIIIGEDKE